MLNEKESRLPIYLFITAISADVISITLGLIVLTGWHTGNKTIIQIHPSFVPMQYNTALGFVLCGSGMLLVLFKRNYVAIVNGILVIVMGGMTLLEYLTGLPLGIDELFMEHAIMVHTSHPGRMAPNTSICFILIGLFLVFSILFKKRTYQFQVKTIFASLTAGLSIVALSGYIIHLDTAYSWGNFTQMAIHTSIGFAALGASALVYAWYDDLNNKTTMSYWLPVPIAIGALTVVISFWQALQSEYITIGKQISTLTVLSCLPTIILIVGVLFVFALATATYLAQASAYYAREAVKANQYLSDKIAEFKMTEDHNRMLSQAIDQSPSTIVITDTKGNIEYVNPKFTQLTGYTAEEAFGKNPRILKTGKIPHEEHKRLWKAITSGKEWHGEFCNKKKNGELYWEIASISPVKNHEGTITNFLAVKEDITERKKVEYELQRNMDLIKLLQELALAVNEAANVKEALKISIYKICIFFNLPISHIYMPDDSGKLQSTNIWYISDPEKFKDFQISTHKTSFDPGEGLPGRVFLSGRPHWIVNVTEDTNFTRAQTARAAGIKAGFAFPVLERKKTLAVLEFFSNKVLEPDNMILDALPLLANQIGRIILRKRADDTLRQINNFNQSLIDTLPFGIDIVDEEGRILYMSKRLESLLGKEAVGEKCWSAYRDDKTQCSNCPLSKKSKRGEIETHNILGGRIFQIFHMDIAYKNKQALLEVFNDITDIKNTENELRTSHGEIEMLLSSIPSIMISLSPDGRIIKFNKKAESTFGVEASKVVDKPFSECGIRWDWNKIIEKISVCQRENCSTWLDALQFSRTDSSYGYLGITINPIANDISGQPGVLILGSEITERLNMEHQLVHAQKLEAIGQLAAGIAHEINTPTQYISNNTSFLQDAFGKTTVLLNKYSHLLEMNKAGTVTPEFINEVEVMTQDINVEYLIKEIPEAIKESQDGIKRVTEIVQSMKTFSHPDQKEKEYVDINEMIKSTIAVSRNEWKYVADMQTHFDPDLPLVLCYAGEFNQAILNLIINATHAISDLSRNEGNGMGKISISTQLNGDWAEIHVSDTGTGIPEEIRSRIFDPFFTTKEVGKGTGQGLSIVHSVIVKKHGGKITFDTATGRGTTFKICLPINQSLSIKEEFYEEAHTLC